MYISQVLLLTRNSKAINKSDQSVESEEILSLNCYGGEKISDTAATVIRSSTIRVVYKDGSVKDISEKYKYTVSFSDGKMKITGLEEL